MKRCAQILTAAILASFALLATGAPNAAALSLGVQWTGSFEQAESEMHDVTKSGATMFRLPLEPDRTSGGASWTYYDNVFGNAAKSGITILPHFHERMSGALGLPTAGEKTSWTEWAQKAVRRYGYNGVFWSTNPTIPARPAIAWEMYNEPNNDHMNGGNITGKEYGEFLTWAGPVVQSTSESWSGQKTGVLFGGLLAWGLETNYQTFFKNAYAVGGVPSAFTGLAFHPYILDPASFPGKSHIQAFKDSVNAAKGLLYSVGAGNKSLWITETGWPAEAEYTLGEAGQASILKESFNWLKSVAGTLDLQAVIWYNYRDISPNIWQYRSGLRKQDGSYRQAWFAYQEVAGVPKWPVPEVVTGPDDNLPGPHVVGQPNGTVDTFFRTTVGGLGHAWTQGGAWSEQGVPETSVHPSSVPHPVIQRNGTIDVFWRTSSNGLGHAWNDAGGWHAHTMAVSLASEPHPALQDNGTIDVFYKTSSNELGHSWYQPGGSWLSNTLASSVASDPYPAAQDNGTIDVFYRTTSGVLGHAWTQGGSWSTQDVSGTSVSTLGAPHGVATNAGQADVFWRKPDGSHGHAWNDAGGWHTDTLSGFIAAGSEPYPVMQPNGTIDVFYRNPSNELGHNWHQPGGAWYYNSVATQLGTDPNPAAQENGTIDVFYGTASKAVGHAWSQGGPWSSGTIAGTLDASSVPHAVAQPNGTIDVLFRNSSGQLGHDWQQAGWYGGTVPGSPAAAAAPKATTGTATGIGAGIATLNGTVNPEGVATKYYFEYGTTTSYGTKKPAAPEPVGAGVSDLSLSQALTGLSSGTTYHYRVVAESAAGTTKGADKTFTP